MSTPSRRETPKQNCGHLSASWTKFFATSEYEIGASIQIKLDSDSLICPSCQNVAPIIVERERKSPAFGVRPVPQEGTSAVVTNVGAGCGGRRLREDEPRGFRTAKSCGPDARIAGVKSLRG
jgi:hypothetical protein